MSADSVRGSKKFPPAAFERPEAHGTRRSSIIEINPPARLKPLPPGQSSRRIDSEYLTSFRSFRSFLLCFSFFSFSFCNHCISSSNDPSLAFMHPLREIDRRTLLSLSLSLIFLLLLREHKEVTKGLTGPKITLLYGNERRGKVWPGPSWAH